MCRLGTPPPDSGVGVAPWRKQLITGSVSHSAGNQSISVNGEFLTLRRRSSDLRRCRLKDQRVAACARVWFSKVHAGIAPVAIDLLQNGVENGRRDDWSCGQKINIFMS